ncbi:hypothetical protein [Alkalihalobacillus sp. AL-G]|uniref:hypothetical protein n=1 Tax=Alkalihalobacillus sp. AL-G TaxID=2926399 RepID=UPI00272CC747|nr:hypothetical protein [Alkalihalobacillus sp. AL-G]WLD93778.1 hypothetical protein MOJ78_02350 [Alkalihalobacillus sp. AL-G]
MDRNARGPKIKNNSEKFKKDRKRQKDVDEQAMPTDDLPLEDIKEEIREEKEKHDSKDNSSTERKHKP